MDIGSILIGGGVGTIIGLILGILVVRGMCEDCKDDK